MMVMKKISFFKKRQEENHSLFRHKKRETLISFKMVKKNLHVFLFL